MLTCVDQGTTDEWFHKLSAEVEYNCSFCHGVHLEIAVLESKLQRAYESTARSMEGLFDVKEIANRWLATYLFASEILGVAQAAREVHQICGADLSKIEMYQAAAWERYAFHCPQARAVA
jgi:hypothetical protein